MWRLTTMLPCQMDMLLMMLKMPPRKRCILLSWQFDSLKHCRAKYTWLAPLHQSRSEASVDNDQCNLAIQLQANAMQAQSRENQSATAEDAAPYCRLACDVLSCAVSACELWRESLLRMKSAMMMGPGTELSVTELSRCGSNSICYALSILHCGVRECPLTVALISVTYNRITCNPRQLLPMVT